MKFDSAGIAITFNSTIFFDTLSAEVKPEGIAILRKLADSVFQRQVAELKIYKIVIEGHTDSRPVLGGPYPSNWELSGARAARVVRLFMERGYDPKNMVAIGYADTRPEIQSRMPSGEQDESALAKNRRVVIRILEPKIDFIPMPEAAGTNAKVLTHPQNGAPTPAVTSPTITSH